MEEKELKELKTFYDIDPEAPYYTTGITVLDEVIGGGLGIGMPGGKLLNICGDASAGKCICEGYVLTDNGFERIEDIGRDLPYGTTPVVANIAYSKDTAVEANFFYKAKAEHTIKLTTKNHNSLEGTPEHKLGVWTRDGIVMKRLDEIAAGDYLVTIGGTEKYGPYQPAPKFPTREDNRQVNTATNPPTIIDEDFGEFLGYVVADGNLIAGVVVSSTNERVQGRVTEFLESMGFSPKRQAHRNVVSSVLLREFLEKVLECGSDPFTARYKKVPPIIMRSPKSVQAAFLKALIECDGHVVSRDGIVFGVEYYTASEHLMNDVRMMLLNMGIHTMVYAEHGARAGDKYYDHTYYRMRIPSRRTNIVENIPFMGTFIGEAVDHIRLQIGWSKNGTNKAGVFIPHLKYKYLCDTVFSLNNFVEAYGHLGEYFPEERPLSFFTDLQKQQYYFDEVTAVDYNYEEVDVFDYHVPDGHLFWANGLINHNTFVAWHMIAANHYFWKAQGVPFKWMYDDTEYGSTLDVDTIYGLDDYEDHIINSATIEEAHSNMNKFIASLQPGERGIYILDSLDPLKTESDVGAVEKDLEKMADGKAVNRGSYDMAKQKYLSSRLFPQVVPLYNEKHAILIILSQVRYNVSGMGAKFTIGGGKAADHNFNARVMLSKTKPIQTTIKGETVDIGAGVKAKLMKNKTPRPMRECQFDLYFTRGIDDVGACIDYLYDLKTDTGLSRPGNIEWDGEKYTKDKLVNYIYENKLVKELRKRTIDKWEEKEAIAAERAKAKIPEQVWEW